MTDQTPNGEKTPKLPTPQKKKVSAYDQPFNVMKDADQMEKQQPQTPPQRPTAQDAESSWRSTSTATPHQSEPTPQPQVKKAPSKEAPKKKKSTNAQTKKAKDEIEKPKTGSASQKKGKDAQVSMELPRSARPAHKVIPYVLYALALFIGVSLLLNIFCNWQNSLTDPSQHWMGIIGYNICYFLFGLFGPAVFTLPLLLLVLGIFWKQYIDHKLAIAKIVASVTFIVSLSAIIHIFCLITLEEQNFTPEALMRHGAEMTGGGLIGGSFGYLLHNLGNFVGSLIIGFFLLAVSLFFLLGMTPQHLWNHLRNRSRTRGHAPSYSEQSAEDAEIRAKMDEKIRRTTSRQMNINDTDDFAAEAPLGAVRVVHPANKKSAEDRMAPMPLPKLDPTEEDKLFVPDKVTERMTAMSQEPAPQAAQAPVQSAPMQQAPAHVAPQTTARVQEAPRQPSTAPAPAPAPAPAVDPAMNRDAAVEPIFPKTAESRQARRIPKADRDFDLKNIFIDLDDSDAMITKKHAPVPPEVPLASTARPVTPKEKRPATAPAPAKSAASVEKTAASAAAPVAKPAPPTAKAQVQPVAATKTAAPAGKPAKPLTPPSIANVKQPVRTIAQPKDFGLTSEEFERLESQQQPILPKAGAPAKKPAPTSADGKPAEAKKAEAPKPQKPAKPKKYVFPPISYLQPGEPMTEENRYELEQSSIALEETLRSFHVGITDHPRYAYGPTVTRYEVTPAAGVRVRTITNLSDDIALALRSSGGIRIEAPIPGTNSVGIEIPNKTRSTIYLRELIESKAFSSSQSKLTACLGSGIAGEPLIFDIAKMPHLLIAGTTGSGKSVCINCIVMSLLYKAKPDEVKLIMIDPKKVEFSIYKNIPHLMAPVVTTPKDAAGALQAAVEEMERRFELFEQVGVRDLKGYNTTTKDDPDMPHLPYIVIIIDELADLMMTARDEVETAICRIAQKARAAGMHLIIGTQRPSADVVTGLIKANVPSRIAFAVKSQVDSRVILDHIGAEALTGRGDMLFVPIGSMRDTRVQGAFVDDKEVERICEFIRATNGTAEYDEKFISKLKELAAQCGNKGRSGGDFVPSAEDGGDKGADSKYADAVRIAIEEKRISTSLLQRKLEIGYSRAAKLIDRMQSEGYVSPPDGSKPRTILITPEEYMEKFIDNPGGGEEA